MRKITKDELEEVLEQHKKWTDSEGKEGKKANLQGAYLQEADLLGADLQGANLREAELQGAYLQGANLQGADLREADLRGADLERADLREANLQEADLEKADLREANLQGANLREADLREAELQGAELQGAELQGADLQGAYLQGANGIKTFQFTHKQYTVLFIYTKNHSYLQIGCLIKSLKKWKNEYIELAKKYNYTDIEIKEVQSFVNCCKQICEEIK